MLQMSRVEINEECFGNRWCWVCGFKYRLKFEEHKEKFEVVVLDNLLRRGSEGEFKKVKYLRC